MSLLHRRARPVLTAAVVGLVLLAAGGSAARGQGEPDPLPVSDPAVLSGMAWHLEATGAPTAWRSSLGAGVRVAVVDSGVDDAHPDLAGQIVASVSCIGAAGDPARCTGPGSDDDGHGTHVAGIVAARADDQVGVAGVAPRAELLAVRALTRDCPTMECVPTGDTADVAAGVRWAVANEADIVNLSLTAARRLGPELTDALAEAWEAGVIPVMAAGNRADDRLFFDARTAVVVTATTRDGRLAGYAQPVDVVPLGLAAPGGVEGDTAETCHVAGEPVGLVSTFARSAGDGSGYACLAGTSMAAPQVSGGLALLLSMGMDRETALERLITSARPGEGLGAGRMDLAAAVARPLPAGARLRHDSFDNGTPTADPDASDVGPFALPRNQGARSAPIWVVIAGGLAAGLMVEGLLRLRAVRRRRDAPAAAGAGADVDGGATAGESRTHGPAGHRPRHPGPSDLAGTSDGNDTAGAGGPDPTGRPGAGSA